MPESIIVTLKLFGSLHADDAVDETAGNTLLSPIDIVIAAGTDSASGFTSPSSSTYAPASVLLLLNDRKTRASVSDSAPCSLCSALR
jgi:hypothetical protein